MKYIYVLSLPHSGSTLLEMLLSKHASLVSLGEVRNTILSIRTGKENTKICSKCESPLDGCQFWGGVKDSVKNAESLSGAYEVVKQLATQNAELAVDSSKRLKDLMDFYGHEPESVKVLFLVRDVRGWVQSIEAKYKKEKIRKFGFGFIINGYFWALSYLKRKRALHKGRFDALEISYEKLALDTKAELQRIFEFLEIGADGFSMENPSNSHNIEGNRMRISFSKTAEVKYDFKWFSDFRHMLYAPLLLPVHWLNSRVGLEGKCRR